MRPGTHTDPRPDIAHDHHLWARILICCQGQPNIQGKLHFIRCLGGQLVETPSMYRILQGDIPDGDWVEVKGRILDQLYPQIAVMFPMWRKLGIPDDVLQFAIDGDMAVDEAEQAIRDCPFTRGQQELFQGD